MQPNVKANNRGIDSELLDQDSLVERCMGNYELVERLLTRYMELVSQDCDLLERALSDEDAKTLALVAHRLKGTSATVGSSRTCQLATLVEQESEAADWPTLRSVVAEIREVHFRVTEHCRQSLGSYQHADACGGSE